MRKFLIAALAFASLAGSVGDAGAYVCARGPYRAGCAGPRGAVGVYHRPYYGYGYHRYGVYRRPYGYYGGYRRW
jgi:hypothetical protein